MSNKDSSKKVLLSVIGIAIFVIAFIGITYAFFNYTRTGSSNVIKVGRISFTSMQNGSINLSNAFPITNEEAETDTTNAKSMSITITGDTDYKDGVEYLVTASDVNLMVGNKYVPVTLEVDVDSNGSLGTEETGNYYTNRENYTTSKYKIEYNGEIEEGSYLLVGYIAPNTTSGTAAGINGTINIKTYFDANKILISDTYDGTETGNMGTLNSLAEGKIVFTTTEWNSIITSPLSFKMKVEANEGIWVENPNVLSNIISRKVSRDYVGSYSDVIASNPTFTTQDTIGINNNKKTVYYYTGSEAVANSNVILGGYCWQIVRTTDTGGVKLIYNGFAQNPVTSTTSITQDDIVVTNDSNYPYTYDANTKKWTSANMGVAYNTDNFIFKVKTAGEYAINYKVSSESGNDRASVYIKSAEQNASFSTQTSFSGDEEGTYDLGTLTPDDTVKISYYKNGTIDYGDDSITFDIAMVNSRSNNQTCDTRRRVNGGDKILKTESYTKQNMSSVTLFGRSYDYNLATGMFTIEDTDGLPTNWSINDSNNNGISDDMDLMGTYTCLNSSSTCQTMYYVGNRVGNSTTSAYVLNNIIVKYTIYKYMGTGLYSADYTNPANVSYMFNKIYVNDDGESISGQQYHTYATWNPNTLSYELSDDPDNPAINYHNSTHHYICDAPCTKVRYYYESYSYLELENGDTIEDALKNMFNYKTNSSDPDANINVYNSVIKGFLDNWYKKNFTDYTSYLDSNAVYCNDRSIIDLGEFNSKGNSSNLNFKNVNANQDLSCANVTDRFSVNNINAAKLTYPIGLLSEPERQLMTSQYAGSAYWEMSPNRIEGTRIYVNYSGYSNFNYNSLYNNYGYRGVITLKPGTISLGGNGTYLNPYIIGPAVSRYN